MWYVYQAVKSTQIFDSGVRRPDEQHNQSDGACTGSSPPHVFAGHWTLKYDRAALIQITPSANRIKSN